LWLRPGSRCAHALDLPLRSRSACAAISSCAFSGHPLGCAKPK
jgi:hypothetical protein